MMNAATATDTVGATYLPGLPEPRDCSVGEANDNGEEGVEVIERLAAGGGGGREVALRPS